jgi:hypothetical protein
MLRRETDERMRVESELALSRTRSAEKRKELVSAREELRRLQVRGNSLGA